MSDSNKAAQGGILTLSTDETELIRRRLVEDVRKEVVAELKRLYAWMGIVATVAVSGVLYVAVWAALADARVKLESSHSVNDLLSTRLADAVNQAEQLRSQSVILVRDFQEAKDRAATRMNDLSARAEELVHKVSTAERGNLVISDDLQKQITQLNSVVERFVTTTTDSGADSTDMLETIRNVEMASDRTSKGIEAAIKRSEFVKYPIYLRRLPGSIALEEDLRSLGFRVHDLGPPSSGAVPTSYDAILIGRDVPKEVAATVLRTAKLHLAFLRFVAEGDRPEEIDIGFPEDEIRERGLQAWSDEDLSFVDELDNRR